MSKPPSLSRVLSDQKRKSKAGKTEDGAIELLQEEMLKIQQGIWHRKARAILVFEGFDAAGKGGCIRKLSEGLDPRGITVHPIGPPSAHEQGIHWLYRFWMHLPPRGRIAVFDRSWYGRVLVERVDELTPRAAWKRAYDEIRAFEKMLTDDGVELIKIFLAVSPEEQFKRFKERLEDPAKRWKISEDDVRARSKWGEYVEAADELLGQTHRKTRHWHVVPSDHKPAAQVEVLELITRRLKPHAKWLSEQRDAQCGARDVRKALKRLARVR